MAEEVADRPVTIYEVARAAQVSPSTVSRTFSRPGRVSVRTADHVRRVAAELGYRDDVVYRATATAKRRTIALAVADITNPLFIGVAKGAEVQATKAGYTVVVVNAQESISMERANFDRVLPLVDGVIIASSRLSDTVLRSIAKTHPVVILNRYVGGVPSVVPDTSSGMRQAISHLLELGHRSVHYLAGPDASWISGMRWLAIRAAAASMGITAHRVGPIPPTIEGGASVLNQLISRRATAAICSSDLAAMGLVRAMTLGGHTVPKDLSIIGCDNIFASDLITPALTTIAAPTKIFGDTAAKHVIAMVGGAHPHVSAPITVPAKLIVRASTGPGPAWRG